MKPLVTILTPFKNTEAFLPACLDSILLQTYTNWELILIDDHSTDTSLSIAKIFASKDIRIKVYKNKGKGIIDALQLGYSKASGAYLTRMDSDDIMTADKLDVLVHNLMKHGRGHIAIGQVSYFSESGINPGYKNYEQWINSLTANGTNFSEIYKECVIPSPCWMIHRDDFEAAGGFNASTYPEDYDLTFRLYKKGFKTIACNKIIHLWRDYSYRSSRTQANYSQLSLLKIRITYFLKLDYKPERPLVIWGAGNKGKFIAKRLVQEKIPFYWICDNPKKINKSIYGVVLQHFNTLASIKNPQSIVAVANPKAQQEINAYFKAKKLVSMQDYYFFC